MLPRLYKPSEAAQVLGISKAYMYKLLSQNPHLYITIGTLKRIPEEQLTMLVKIGTPTALPDNVARFVTKPSRSARPWRR